MRRHLVLATCFFFLLGHPALAADPPKPPPEQRVTLTREQVSTVEWFLKTYGGEHCTLADDPSFVYCQGAVQGKLLLMDIDRQVRASADSSSLVRSTPTK